MSGFISIIAKWPVPKILASVFAVKILYYLLFASVIYALGGDLSLSNYTLSFYLLWWKVVFPALIETFYSQYLVLEFYRRLRISEKTGVLLSALVFAIGHAQGIVYALYEFPVGIIYALAYLIFKEKRFHPFLMVALVHLLWNFLVLIL